MFGFLCLAQETNHRVHTKKYISKTAYLKQFQTIADTVEIRIMHGDTMVQVPLDHDLYGGRNIKKVLYEPKDSLFLKTYKAVAYNTDHKIDSSRFMRYWKDDIRIYFDESVPAKDVDHLMNFAKRISSDIDSLTITRNFIKEKSNYHIFYLNEDHPVNHEPRIGDKSGFYVNWNKKRQIYKASLKINTTVVTSDLLKINLLEYHFFKSLGYFSSSKDLDCSSILSACSTYRKLSQEDLDLLKYHYSYGVCKGQTLKSFTDLTNHMQDQLAKDPNALIYVVHEE